MLKCRREKPQKKSETGSLHTSGGQQAFPRSLSFNAPLLDGICPLQLVSWPTERETYSTPLCYKCKDSSVDRVLICSLLQLISGSCYLVYIDDLHKSTAVLQCYLFGKQLICLCLLRDPVDRTGAVVFFHLSEKSEDDTQIWRLSSIVHLSFDYFHG